MYDQSPVKLKVRQPLQVIEMTKLKVSDIGNIIELISFFCHVNVLLVSSYDNLFEHSSGIKPTQTVNSHLYRPE